MSEVRFPGEQEVLFTFKKKRSRSKLSKKLGSINNGTNTTPKYLREDVLVELVRRFVPPFGGWFGKESGGDDVTSTKEISYLHWAEHSVVELKNVSSGGGTSTSYDGTRTRMTVIKPTITQKPFRSVLQCNYTARVSVTSKLMLGENEKGEYVLSLSRTRARSDEAWKWNVKVWKVSREEIVHETNFEHFPC